MRTTKNKQRTSPKTIPSTWISGNLIPPSRKDSSLKVLSWTSQITQTRETLPFPPSHRRIPAKADSPDTSNTREQGHDQDSLPAPYQEAGRPCAPPLRLIRQIPTKKSKPEPDHTKRGISTLRPIKETEHSTSISQRLFPGPDNTHNGSTQLQETSSGHERLLNTMQCTRNKHRPDYGNTSINIQRKGKDESRRPTPLSYLGVHPSPSLPTSLPIYHLRRTGPNYASHHERLWTDSARHTYWEQAPDRPIEHTQQQTWQHATATQDPPHAHLRLST